MNNLKFLFISTIFGICKLNELDVLIINDTSYVVTKTDSDSTNENEDKELIGVYMMAQVQNVKS